MVVGVTGIQVDINKNITKNKHTSVLPMFRGMGLGKLLVTEALRNCTTDTIYATIRSNNTQSINLYQSLGFVCSEYYLSNGNKILVFRRRIK
jgi:ribosomal protein S18 acetylase RimI-like enzyme